MSTVTSEAILAGEQLLAFVPDPKRGQLLYDRAKNRLLESFRQIAQASCSVAHIDEKQLAGFVRAASQTQKISPRFFAIYHEMLAAIDEDDVDGVSRLFAELVIPDGDQTFTCRNLTDEHLGAGQSARYKRWADMDPESPLALKALDAIEFERIAASAREGMALMDAGAPEVSGDIRALLAEILFAKGEFRENLVFHGISSFYLWGTVLLNAESHKTTLEVVQTLAHETSHMHLFAVALDSPLVENPESERYHSPLRLDPRPMDGIYHATYVAARMHYVIGRLLSSGALSAAKRDEAVKAAANHVASFKEGYDVVRSHGRLTELGEGLLTHAHAYMQPYL